MRAGSKSLPRLDAKRPRPFKPSRVSFVTVAGIAMPGRSRPGAVDKKATSWPASTSASPEFEADAIRTSGDPGELVDEQNLHLDLAAAAD